MTVAQPPHLSTPTTTLLTLALTVTTLFGFSSQAADTANHGVNLSILAMDASPCEDLNKHANLKWQLSNPIPAGLGQWDALTELTIRARQSVQQLILKANGVTDGSLTQKVGDFYASGLSETRSVSTAIMEPIRLFKGGADSKTKLANAIGIAHRLGSPIGFDLSTRSDPNKPSAQQLQLTPPRLGLPDRSWYTSDDEPVRKLRDIYVIHISRMFQLIGMKPDAAKSAAQAVLALEIKLAKAGAGAEAATPTGSASPRILSINELKKQAPGFDWNTYFHSIKLPDGSALAVSQPAYFTQFAKLIGTESGFDWWYYSTWQIVHRYAPYMGETFDKENFNFYGKLLSGQKEFPPREARVTATLEQLWPNALGQLYVEQTLDKEARQKVLTLAENIRAAMRTRLSALEWLSSSGRQAAIARLNAITLQIGHPLHWPDNTGLTIKRDDYLGNITRTTEFHFQRMLNQLSKPSQPGNQPTNNLGWPIPAYTTQIVYQPESNRLIVPAGLLQPPFFDSEADEASNYGAIGNLIALELTRSLDQTGWTAEDKQRFAQHEEALVRQYNIYTPIDELHINGRTTLAANIADAGGLQFSYLGLQTWLDSQPAKVRDTRIEQLSHEQRFFLSFAQARRQNMRADTLRAQVQTGTSAPARYRIIGPLSNFQAFQQAFGCTADDPMINPEAKRVSIW